MQRFTEDHLRSLETSPVTFSSSGAVLIVAPSKDQKYKKWHWATSFQSGYGASPSQRQLLPVLLRFLCGLAAKVLRRVGVHLRTGSGGGWQMGHQPEREMERADCGPGEPQNRHGFDLAYHQRGAGSSGKLNWWHSKKNGTYLRDDSRKQERTGKVCAASFLRAKTSRLSKTNGHIHTYYARVNGISVDPEVSPSPKRRTAFSWRRVASYEATFGYLDPLGLF